MQPATVDNSRINPMQTKLALLRPASLRKRLWQAGGALLLLAGVLVIGNLFLPAHHAVTRTILGRDFLAFYSAGAFARQGHFDRMYDLAAIGEMEQSVARQAGLEFDHGVGPYWNPPFYAWALAPLATMSFGSALSIWTMANLLCMGLAIILLVRTLPAVVAHPPKLLRLHGDDPLPLKFKRDWRNWALLPLLLCLSMPFIQALTHGQNTFCSLLLLTLIVAAWRNRMPVAAGIACGLMLYKPQLVAVVAAMLVLNLGLRVCLGLGFIAGILIITTALAMPDAIGNYLHQLPLNLRSIQVDGSYPWERHATLIAFFRLLIQGSDAAPIARAVSLLTLASSALVSIGLLFAWQRTNRPGLDDVWTGETRSLARDRLIGAAITTMPLLMPFYFDYDLLLLAIPATLFAGELTAMPPGARLDRSQRLLISAWAALYGWAFVNAAVAAASGVNVGIILLSAVSGLSIYRCCCGGVRTSSILLPQVQRTIVRRAA